MPRYFLFHSFSRKDLFVISLRRFQATCWQQILIFLVSAVLLIHNNKIFAWIENLHSSIKTNAKTFEDWENNNIKTQEKNTNHTKLATHPSYLHNYRVCHRQTNPIYTCRSYRQTAVQDTRPMYSHIENRPWAQVPRDSYTGDLALGHGRSENSLLHLGRG